MTPGTAPHAWRELPRAFWIIFTAAIINGLGNFVAFLFAFYLQDRFGLQPTATGLLIGLFALGTLVGSFFAGQLSDHIGRKPVLFWFQTINALCMTIMAFTTDIALGVLLVLIGGICGGGARPVFMALTTDCIHPVQRRLANTMMYWVMNLTIALAVVIASWFAQNQWYTTAFLADAGTLIAATLLVVLAVRVPPRHPAPAKTTKPPATLSIWRDRTFCWFLAATFFASLGFAHYNQPLAMATKLAGYTATQFSTLIAVNTTLAVVLSIAVTKHLTRFDASTLMATGSFIMAIGFLGYTWMPSFAWLLATTLIWTIGEVLNLPNGGAVTADLSPEHARGHYAALVMVMFGLGAALAPISAGYLLEHVHNTAVWGLAAAAHLTSGTIHLRQRHTRRHRINQLQQSPTGHLAT